MASSCRRVVGQYGRALTLTGVVFAAAAAAACATQSAAAPSFTNDANAPLYVEVSGEAVAVHNRTGAALVNVSVVLLPTQGSPFTAMVARIENQGHHRLALSDLKTSQGTAFTPIGSQALKVLVAASNVAGQRFEVDVPLK